MKTIYLAWKMIWKQKFMNLFLIITILLSIYYLSPVLSQVIYYKTSIRTLKCLDMTNAYYLYCNPFHNRRNPDVRESVNKKVSDLDYVKGRAEFFYLNDENFSCNIMVYNDLLAKKFVPQIAKGSWLDIEHKNAYIPAVVSADMKLSCGEIFPLSLALNDRTIEVSCKVVGVLEKGAQIPEFSNAADEVNFTTDALIGRVNAAVIIPICEELDKFLADDAYLCNSSGSILFTEEGINYETVLKDFGYAGIVTDMENGNNRFYEQSKAIVAAMGAYFGVYFIIAIVCMLCNSFILSVNSQKIYAIYFLTGMSRSKRSMIELMRIFLLIFICTVISFYFMDKSGIITNFFEGVYPLWIIIGVICYVSMIFLPVSIGFMMKSRKIMVIDLVRKINEQI